MQVYHDLQYAVYNYYFIEYIMTKFFLWTGGTVLPLLLLSGCIDNNYDLSDIDTTTEIKINDLVVPVNVDAIALRDVFTFDEDSKIDTLTMNGKTFYAITQGGEFNSFPISIPVVRAEAPYMAPAVRTLARTASPSGRPSRAAGDAYAISYSIVKMDNEFAYNAYGVSEAIVSIDEARVDRIDFNVRLSTEGLDGLVEALRFTDLELRLPAGLALSGISAGSYDSASGVWSVPELELGPDGGTITLSTEAVSLRDAVISQDRTLTYTSEFQIDGGVLAVVPKMNGSTPAGLPDEIRLKAEYSVNDLVVNAVKAHIDYCLDGMEISPVELSDLPDFLDNPQTNIILENPQIYLNLNNPVADDGLIGRIGLDLTAERSNGVNPIHFNLDEPFVLGTNNGVNGPYNFVLVPQATELTVPDGYSENLQRVNFNGLSNLLSVPEEMKPIVDGERVAGLPDRIDILVADPRVTNDPGISESDRPWFVLGERNPSLQVTGRYELIAPLALCDGSLIIYSNVQDWDSEDMENMQLRKISISCHGVSTLPVGAELTVYPVDRNGRRIDCVTKSMEVAAGGELDMELAIDAADGKYITGVAGIEYVAVLKAGADGEPLQTGQTINLTNIRARVSGSYIKKF